MTAPNILQVSTITGRTSVLSVTTSPTAIVTNAADSNSLLKINSLIVSNIDGTNTCDITVDLFRDSVAYKIASTVPVVPDTSFVAIDKDFFVYVEEGDSIRLTASSNSDLTAICSYEVIT
jgi:hypothetical protein